MFKFDNISLVSVVLCITRAPKTILYPNKSLNKCHKISTVWIGIQLYWCRRCHRRSFFGTLCVLVCAIMSLRVYSKSLYPSFSTHLFASSLFLNVATEMSFTKVCAHVVCICIWANLFYAYRIFSSIVQMDVFFYFDVTDRSFLSLSLSSHLVLLCCAYHPDATHAKSR